MLSIARKGKMATGYRHNNVANLYCFYGVGGCLFIFSFLFTSPYVDQPKKKKGKSMCNNFYLTNSFIVDKSK